ncbi:uncharacterized protein LOC119315572 [Triticum dicoccoides]|uniref:uncharacterized protein LOC119315572 n=1 Tax=Triticum dicoccoides TaxID=85692 RepID=UPI0018916BC3|nr:uncharacterized protein LOC119315572 [Triticum dicoccoides]
MATDSMEVEHVFIEDWLSPSDSTYQVIKTPSYGENDVFVKPYLGRSEKGVYFGVIEESQLRVWILSELSEQQMEWVLKYQHDLAHYAQHVGKYGRQMDAHWMVHDVLDTDHEDGDVAAITLPKEKFDWDSDNDDVFTIKLDADEYPKHFDILGLHPYKEVVYLTTPRRASKPARTTAPGREGGRHPAPSHRAALPGRSPRNPPQPQHHQGVVAKLPGATGSTTTRQTNAARSRRNTTSRQIHAAKSGPSPHRAAQAPLPPPRRRTTAGRLRVNHSRSNASAPESEVARRHQPTPAATRSPIRGDHQREKESPPRPLHASFARGRHRRRRGRGLGGGAERLGALGRRPCRPWGRSDAGGCARSSPNIQQGPYTLYREV